MKQAAATTQQWALPILPNATVEVPIACLYIPCFHDVSCYVYVSFLFQQKLVRLLPARHVAMLGGTSQAAYLLTRDESVWEVTIIS